MKVLPRYFCKEFFRLFILCQVVFLSIYLVIDFLQKIDNLIDADVSQGIMFSYFFLKLPNIIVQMTPVATLISVIVMFSLMKRDNEIMAMKASGLNILELSKTLILISLFIGGGIFIFSELIVPYTSSRSNELWNIDVEKQDPGSFYGSNQIWYKSRDAIYWIKHFDGRKKIMENPTFYFFNKDFRLIKKIDGKRGIWKEGMWVIQDGVIHEAAEDGSYQVKKFDDLYLELPETPETFMRGVKRPEDMSYRQLQRHALKVKREGYDNARYLVDMHMKISFPLVNLILVITGIPIALGLIKGGTPLAVSLGIGICFLYMVTLGISRSLGLAGLLPPVLSAWAANLIFLFFGIYLLKNVER